MKIETKLFSQTLINGAVSGILNALVVFGVLNNPTDPTNF